MQEKNHFFGLLRRYGKFHIPGIGLFQLKNKSAEANFIHKSFSPPSSTIVFLERAQSVDENTHVDVNKGQSILAQLENKETVVLPKVGSLFMDFRNGIRFIETESNNNDYAYGLGSIPFSILSNSPKVSTTLPQQAKLNVTRPSLRKQFTDVLLSLIIAVTLIALGSGVWYGLHTKRLAEVPSQFDIAESTLEHQRQLEQTLDYDAKWSLPGYLEGDSVDMEDGLDSIEAVTGIETPKPELIAEKPKLVKKKINFKIAVGAFGSIDNAKNLKKKLSKLGYESMIEQKASIHKVLVISSSTENNKTKVLRDIQNLVNPQAYFVK